MVRFSHEHIEIIDYLVLVVRNEKVCVVLYFPGGMLDRELISIKALFVKESVMLEVVVQSRKEFGTSISHFCELGIAQKILKYSIRLFVVYDPDDVFYAIALILNHVFN
jgi:hypothetical protein